MTPGRTPGPRPSRRRRAPLLIGHRGASAHAPENTLASFERALHDGADWIECDVRLSADDVPIILHDATLDRTTDGRGSAASLPLASILRLDAGSWFAPRFRGERVPMLAEVLALLDGRGGINLELKIDEPGDRVRAAHARLALAVE
ncbi:MAG TPA: glycerophosphodiester phosphodiesterase family protein, partial [Candidatus Polarisedimenticolia bacterium]|nr:glycerophosphodiester phosphodiesterase family protein [Candidatus Polarisedimenticolia bacterium]